MTIGPAPMIRMDLRSVRLGIRVQLIQDCGQRAFLVLGKVVVPEAKDAIANCAQPFGAGVVVGDLIRVLATIDFYDQFCFLADKIDNVGSDRHLAAELGSVQSAITQQEPEPTLRIGLPHPQLTCARYRHDDSPCLRYPSPWPSPSRGEGTL